MSASTADLFESALGPESYAPTADVNEEAELVDLIATIMRSNLDAKLAAAAGEPDGGYFVRGVVAGREFATSLGEYSRRPVVELDCAEHRSLTALESELVRVCETQLGLGRPARVSVSRWAQGLIGSKGYPDPETPNLVVLLLNPEALRRPAPEKLISWVRFTRAVTVVAGEQIDRFFDTHGADLRHYLDYGHLPQ